MDRATAPETPQTPPQRLEPIAQGGSSVVWRAWHGGRIVAMKVAREGDPGAAARLRHEAEAATLVSSPRVLRPSELVEVDGAPALVMPYLVGGSLADRLRLDGPLPAPRSFAVGRQIVEGLAALHAAGLAHADVKPGNVLLDADGGAVLADLGSCARLGGGTATAPREGSPAYLAPELLADHAPTVASDLFAFGATLHELLTGELPDVPGPADAAGTLRQRVPGLPAAAYELVGSLLAPDPSHRPGSAEAVRTTLDTLVTELATWQPDADQALRTWAAVPADPRVTRTFGPRPPLEQAPSEAEGPSRAAVGFAAVATFATPVVAALLLTA